MESPPLDAGGVMVTVALPGDVVEEVAAERVGAPGTVFGMTATDGAEISEI